MKQSDLPTKIQTPFASGAGSSYIRTVPVASQIGITDGAASFTDGFPPLNAQPETSGGIPPSIQDFNGVLNQMSAIERAFCSGAIFPFDSDFSAAIGGYPLNSIVSGSGPGIFYLSTVDNNTTIPGASGSNWRILWGGSYNETSGYRIGPDGFLEQWGTVNLPASEIATSSAQITFPQKFSTVCFGVNLTGMNYANTTDGGWPTLSMTAPPALGGVEIIGDTLTGRLSDPILFNQIVPVFWRATGY